MSAPEAIRHRPQISLPADLKHVFHRHGGQILRIERCAHTEGPMQGGRSGDSWHFIGDVKWSETGYISKAIEISPHCVCFEHESLRFEADALSYAMSDYLDDRGEWLEGMKGWRAELRSSAIEVDSRPWQISHGGEPRGRGSWAFNIALPRDPEIVFWHKGTYSEARKAACKRAACEGIERIEVLP